MIVVENYKKKLQNMLFQAFQENYLLPSINGFISGSPISLPFNLI